MYEEAEKVGLISNIDVICTGNYHDGRYKMYISKGGVQQVIRYVLDIVVLLFIKREYNFRKKN